MNKRANEDTIKDMLIGAGLGAVLPASSHARYELFDRPAFKRQIHDLVDQAQRENKLFAAPRSARYADGLNPLQKKMKLGDTVLQSYTDFSLRDLIKNRDMNYGTLSLGASGGPFTHAGVSTMHGQIIDPGKTGVLSFKDALVSALSNPRSLTRSEFDKLRKLRTIRGRKGGDALYLLNNGTDAFGSGYEAANASVVMRPDANKATDKAITKKLADIKSVGYSKTDAFLAGLKRLALPTRPSYKTRGPADLLEGTFCSHGACSIQSLSGLKTPAFKDVLPSDLIKTPGQSLVGIGVNRSALDSLKGSGLKGSELLAEAAKKTMLNSLKTGISGRRGLATALTGLTATAGALGGFLGNKAFGSE